MFTPLNKDNKKTSKHFSRFFFIEPQSIQTIFKKMSLDKKKDMASFWPQTAMLLQKFRYITSKSDFYKTCQMESL